MQIIVRQGTVSFDELKWNTDYVVQLYFVIYEETQMTWGKSFLQVWDFLQKNSS